jgi:hypothetical protein
MKNSIAIVLMALPVALAACMTGSPDAADQDQTTAPDPADEASVDGPPVPLPEDAPILDAHQRVLDQVIKAPDPQSAYNQLSAADRAEFDSLTQPAGGPTVDTTISDDSAAVTPDAVTPDAVTPDADSAAKFNGCWSVHVVARRKSLLGNTLYTFWQTTRVCAKGGKVTSVAVPYANGETSTLGWRKRAAATRSKRNVGWEGRGLAAYHFVFGVGGWNIQHPSDCLQLRLNADGRHFRVLHSCDLEAR